METDLLIKQLIEKVASKKESIQKLSKPDYKTNLTFSFSNDNRNVVNLNTISDISSFINILRLLVGEHKNHNKACRLLNTNIVFKWGNYTYDDWLHDIKIKSSNLTISDKKRELKLLEDKLNNLVSPEVKRQMELEAIQKLLEE